MSAEHLRATLGVFRDLVTTHADALDALNVFPVPDADTGTNMARTLDAVVAAVDDAGPTMAELCAAVGRGGLYGAHGNSGIILGQWLRGTADHLAPHERPDAHLVAGALAAGAAAAHQAVLHPAPGTMLTVAHEAAVVAAAPVAAGVVAVLDAARAAATQAVLESPRLLPALRAAGVVDSGGAGLALAFDAALHVLAGRPLPTELAFHAPDRPMETADGPGFEVMFTLRLPGGRGALAPVTTRWSEIGDSIVVSGDESAWGCHVHSDDPDEVVAAARRAGGDVDDVRITALDAGAPPPNLGS